jgi:hypothetical protein
MLAPICKTPIVFSHLWRISANSLLFFITWLSALQQGEGSSVHFFDRLRKFVECLEFVIPLRRHVDRRGVDRCMTELILDNLDRNTIRNRM